MDLLTGFRLRISESNESPRSTGKTLSNLNISELSLPTTYFQDGEDSGGVHKQNPERVGFHLFSRLHPPLTSEQLACWLDSVLTLRELLNPMANLSYDLIFL